MAFGTRARPEFLLLAVLAAACSSTPEQPPDAEARLVAAETRVAAGRWDEAEEILEQLAGDACPKRLRDRRDIAIASLRQGQGDLWGAFQALETFPDLYSHSDLRPVVVEKVWEIGSSLAQSDAGFLFFWSDRRAGRTVLEHLITRHPDTQRLADALRILGDMAFEDQDFELAQTRFRDLMLNRPESEWFAYAQFRFAMSIVASLEGPEYDLERMQHAVRELRDFLNRKTENPEMLRVAHEAEERLRSWQAQRHLQIAAFYRRVDNPSGERHHLGIAAGEEFAGTRAHAEAVERRKALPEAAPAQPVAPTSGEGARP